MLLKRNLFTILYSLLFIAFFGLGLLQLVYLSVTNSDNRNIIACIIVLGIIIYLIAAFFVKESGSFQIIQRNTPILTVTEILVTVLMCGGLFYMMLDKGLDNAALIVLMLVSIYISGRLLGGRLCGFMSLLIGFFFILSMANTEFDSEQYINTLCFLLPYAMFLFITKVLTKSFVESGFIIFISYLALSVIFALFIVLNPMTCILLFGCVFSLIFGKPEKKGSIVAAGPFSAGLLLVCTALLLVGIRLYMPNLFLLPELDVDIIFLRSSSLLEIAEYVIEKYTKAVNHLFQPFQIGIFPSILLFLGCASGYYAIRKKASGIGPLCLTYLLVLTYYLLCGEAGSHFYYMTYFLPVFASYGFYNTLLSEEWVSAVRKKKESEPEEKEKIEEKTPVEKEKREETLVEKEDIAAPTEKENVETPIKKGKEKQKEEIKPVKTKEKKAMMKPDEIPEWHVPENYSVEYSKEEVLQEDNKEEEMNPENTNQENVNQEDVNQEDNPGDDNLEEVDNSLIEEGIVDVSLAEEDTEDTSVLKTDNTELKVNEEDDEEKQLNNFLDRLDISENIRRMNESAQEDMADIIEREDSQEELLSAIPMEDLEVIEGADGKLYADSSPAELLPERVANEQEDAGTLPKYEAPEFDYKIEPVTQSLQETYTNISEYDEVPTIHGLEQEWKNTEKEEKGSGFAYSLDDVKETGNEEAVTETQHESYNIHSEEIVRKNGIGKRSYHKITIE